MIGFGSLAITHSYYFKLQISKVKYIKYSEYYLNM